MALEYDEEDIQRWRKFIAGKDERFGEFLDHKPFPGVHVVADKQFNNVKLEPYKLTYAPTHALIDHKGNIVSARATRSNAIAPVIDSLLLVMQSQ